jgi:LAS superfamily LD-carboxypeptidase LdcB
MVKALSSHASRVGSSLGIALAVTSTVLAMSPPGLAFAGSGRMAAQPSGGSSLQQLRIDVAQTSDRLAKATTAWERGQQQLAILVQRKISTGQAADELQIDAQKAQQRVSAFANTLYRNPVDPMFTAVLTGDANAITDVMFVQRALRRTSSDRQQDARLLSTRATQTRALVAGHAEAAAGAIQLQKNLDVDLIRLQADAEASVGRLQAAVAEVHRREAATAAAALSRGAATGATCSNMVVVDAINGFLPISALCPLRTAPGQRLVAAAATAFDAMSTAFASAFNKPLCVTDSYRDYASQVQVFKAKPNLAATPGRSKHGLGLAVDLCGGVQSYGTPPYNWLKQNSALFGFTHPDWAEPDGSRPEPWHWEFPG